MSEAKINSKEWIWSAIAKATIDDVKSWTDRHQPDSGWKGEGAWRDSLFGADESTRKFRKEDVGFLTIKVRKYDDGTGRVVVFYELVTE